MDGFKTWLAGKKTYIVAAIAILTTLAAWASGSVTAWEALMAILGALGLSTTHAAIVRTGSDSSGN